MLEYVSLLASRLNRSYCLTSVFSLRAFDRARSFSLVPAEAGGSGHLRLLGPLPRHQRELSIAMLRRFVVIFAARNHHVS